MANHGGRTAPLARTHRPRAPIMSVPAPVTAPLTPLRPPAPAPSAQPAVTLTAPRPDTERVTNEYVETPFRSTATSASAVASAHHHHQHSPLQPPPLLRPAADKTFGATPPALAPRPARLPAFPSSASSVTVTIGRTHHHHHQQQQQQQGTLPPPAAVAAATAATITKQPIAFTKEHPSAASALGAIGTLGECASSGNIICQQCGRCKCESCKQPRALPQRWVCDNALLCSADAVIDYVSCLCCVKGLYYHCSESDAGTTTCADDPCSCGPSRRLARWGCLSALATVLPCLLCYWPLRGCQRAVEAAYARHSRAGCRCPPRSHPHPHSHSHSHATTPEKRLLDSSPEF